VWVEWERREMHTKFWLENPKEEPLGRSRHIWEDNIRMDLRKIRWEDVDWIRLAWDRTSSRLL
jgi:hypothetical protein